MAANGFDEDWNGRPGAEALPGVRVRSAGGTSMANLLRRLLNSPLDASPLETSESTFL